MAPSSWSLRHGVRLDVEDDELVAGPHQPAREVRAHPTQSHHAQLHLGVLLSSDRSGGPGGADEPGRPPSGAGLHHAAFGGSQQRGAR